MSAEERTGASKLAVAIGLVLATVGAYLLVTVAEPTRKELENPYGDTVGLGQKVGGWACLGVGVLILIVAVVRAMRAPRHDPDLPPEYRV